jgi:hypothetical protein
MECLGARPDERLTRKESRLARLRAELVSTVGHAALNRTTNVMFPQNLKPIVRVSFPPISDI